MSSTICFVLKNDPSSITICFKLCDKSLCWRLALSTFTNDSGRNIIHVAMIERGIWLLVTEDSEASTWRNASGMVTCYKLNLSICKLTVLGVRSGVVSFMIMNPFAFDICQSPRPISTVACSKSNRTIRLVGGSLSNSMVIAVYRRAVFTPMLAYQG